MDAPSPLLQLPEHIWTDIILASLPDVRDRVSACLACRRFFDYWSNAVFNDVRRRQVALTVGRFVQRWDGPKGGPALHFQLEQHGPRFEWLQLLDRFLALCAPRGHKFGSFLHPHNGLPRRLCSRRKVAKTCPETGSATADPAVPEADGVLRRTADQAATEAPRRPGVWVCLPRFQPNPQQPHAAAAGGYCVGHLPRSSGISICLLMSGASSSYYFELPRLQLVLSTNRADRTAEARLELCQIRPVLRPGV